MMPCSTAPSCFVAELFGKNHRSTASLSVFLVAIAACSRPSAPRVATADGPRTDAISVNATAPVDGAAAAPPAPDDEAPPVVTGPPAKSSVPSITAVSGYERIVQNPDDKGALIGLVRAGQSVPLADPNPITKAPPGIVMAPCKGGWYAVKPRGFVCLGPNSSLDSSDVRAAAAREVLPDVSKPLPFHVGLAIGSPRYLRIPTRDEQRASEKGLDDYLAHLPAPNQTGEIDTSPAGHGPTPAFVRYVEAVKPALTSDEDAYAGRKIAWTREFDAEGRTWLVTPDLMLVPKDKVRSMTASTLHGIDLKEHPEVHLPQAFTWLGDAPKLQKTNDGRMVETSDVVARHSFVGVKPNLVREQGGFYWVTEDGFYVHNDLFTVFKRRTDKPKGVTANDKWVDVKITWGTLVAYEGDDPVFITAISPGQDGVTVHSNGHNTNRGLFTVGWKLYSADMSGRENGKDWAVDEVPFVAYYHESFALHGAFWHDEFGRPKSHGCVNLSPADAQWMWSWMNPDIPEGWYAVAAYYPVVKTTYIDVGP
jgi:hypothetical protein